MNIKENIEAVRADIAAAAARCGRSESEILLIAVSKTYPADDIKIALECGITDIGENKVQEMCLKKPLLPEKTNIHLIGHLQTNKVKQALGAACMIHSVDSVHLAKEISKESVKLEKTTDILLQVNIAGDEAKFGFSVGETDEALGEIETLPGLKIRGFMTVPRVETDESITRKYFRDMYRLYDKYKNAKKFDCLSMGMSGDFEIAVEEGATMVRVGSKIFGKRNYNV